MAYDNHRRYLAKLSSIRSLGILVRIRNAICMPLFHARIPKPYAKSRIAPQTWTKIGVVCVCATMFTKFFPNDLRSVVNLIRLQTKIFYKGSRFSWLVGGRISRASAVTVSFHYFRPKLS